jgi:membrane protease YdiL (CAAX protease family)
MGQPIIDETSAIAGATFLALLLASVVVWSLALTRWQRGLPVIDSAKVPRAEWPPWSVLIAVAWIAVLAAGRLQQDLEPDESLPSVSELAAQTGITAAIWLSVLVPLLAGNRALWPAFGFSLGHWPQELRHAALAYLASLLPTFVLLQATSFVRSEERQHDYLRLVAESPDGLATILIFVTAALLVPLAEELLFRVMLQGWLSDGLGASWGIALTAVIFAVCHGWRDGLALLPLALILGWLFERRRSYLAVVVTHAVFNSVMLGLQWLAAGRPD